jgi:DNA-binding transcriptional MocR family regulator
VAGGGGARRNDAGFKLFGPLARVRAHYLENRDVLIAALKRNFGEGGISGEGGALHLLWRLPPGVPDAGVVEAMAARRRIGVYSLSSGGRSRSSHPYSTGGRS